MNKELAKKVQSVLKELGHEVSLGHSYELLSRLSGDASHNVSKAKGTVFADVIPVSKPPYPAVDVSQGGRTFIVKIKETNYDMELNKFYRISASSEKEARAVMQEYLHAQLEELEGQYEPKYPLD